MPASPHQRGSGFIEVLVLMLLLGLGMLAMARLHGHLQREAAAADRRALALQLAQDRLETLRTFKCPVFAEDSSCPVSAGDADFAGMGSGSESIDEHAGVELTTRYTRTWTSTPYYFCTPGDAATTDNPCGRPYPDYFTLRVQLDWQERATPQTLTLESAVHAGDILATAQAAGASGPGYSAPVAPAP